MEVVTMRINWKTLLAIGTLLGIFVYYFILSLKVAHDNQRPLIPPSPHYAVRWYKIGKLTRAGTVRFRSSEGTGFYVSLGPKRQFIAGSGSASLPRGPILVSDPHVAITGMDLTRRGSN